MMEFKKYLELSDHFKLGSLTTEGFHHLTTNLSHDSNDNLLKGIQSLKEVDELALGCVKEKSSEIYSIYKKISKSINGSPEVRPRIFLCGCGATGRLSLAIETLSIQLGKSNIISFMAGGDYALIKSVESFEDETQYGAKQLMDLGFRDGDILLAITEGGETSFVIGAALKAAEVSKGNTYFLYCNPDEELLKIDRCREVLTNQSVHKLNLTVGAMALSGSTRMQASTVQMLVAGMICLKNFSSLEELQEYVSNFITFQKALDYSLLRGLVLEESQLYKEEKKVTYTCPKELSISVLTDTTERSPTFNLHPFESHDNDPVSLSYLSIDETENSQEAWMSMLGREPRFLDWGEKFKHISLASIYAFDISARAVKRRAESSVFKIENIANGIVMRINNQKEIFCTKELDTLQKHLVLKLLLNTHSTLVMGRLNRYESNIMTWVKPSNYKLIDRACRYALQLLSLKELYPEYKDVLRFIFENRDAHDLSSRSVVLRAVDFFNNK